MAETPATPVLPSPNSLSRFPSKDGIPLWSGEDSNYSVFTFLRRVKDALAPATLTSKEKVTFIRACMSCDTLTAAGAALEDDFYSTCEDFDSFCDHLIKEFACADNDPCLASLTNLTDLLSSNSASLSPRIAAGLAGRFRSELDHSLTHSRWLSKDSTLSKENFLNLFSYVLYTNLLNPEAASLTRDMSFTPESTIHDLKVSVEAKLRKPAEKPTMCAAPPPPPPPAPHVTHSAPKTATPSKWCYYHRTPYHSAAECNFLIAQRQGKKQDFRKSGVRR